MKQLLIVLSVTVLAGCGGGGTQSSSGDVDVTGSIYNPGGNAAALASSLDMSAGVAGSIERLADVSKGSWILVSTVVSNNAATKTSNLSFEIEVEDAHYSTPESWVCHKKYNTFDGSGTYGFTVWEVFTEPVPGCNGEPADQAFVCEDYQAPLNCANPFWEVTYNAPVEGLWKASGNVPELAPGQTYEGTAGYSNGSGIDVRPDHKARWIVRDAAGGTVASKEYIFNVVP